MKQYRLNRLFNAKSGRCFDVAVDHGFFNQPGFLTGIEDMRSVVKTLVDAAPDAIQLTLGMARHLQEIPGRFKPSLVLRTDVANIYGKELPDTRFSLMIEETMLQAVRYDASCVCVNLFQIPGAPEVHAQCVENILRLKPQADYYGMPMMIEPLVFQPNEKAGGYMVNGDETAITYLVRQAVELGADIVKADPTDDVSVYHKIIASASGIPYTEGLIKNRYVHRTFIQPDQALREHGIKLKFNPMPDVLSGRRVIVVDDSIVRGTTTRKIVEMLRGAGATEVHLRISSPPVISPCFYGIDMAAKDQLIAAHKSLEEIRQHLGADSLAYLSLEGLEAATGHGDERYCRACLTGKYPTTVPIAADKDRFEATRLPVA